MAKARVDIAIETNDQAVARLQQRIQQLEGSLERFGRTADKAGAAGQKAFDPAGPSAFGKALGEMQTRVASLGAAIQALTVMNAKLDASVVKSQSVSDQRVALSSRGVSGQELDNIARASDRALLDETEAYRLFDPFSRSEVGRKVLGNSSFLNLSAEAMRNLSSGDRSKAMDQVAAQVETGVDPMSALATILQASRHGGDIGENMAETSENAVVASAGASHILKKFRESEVSKRARENLKDSGVGDPTLMQLLMASEPTNDVEGRSVAELRQALQSQRAVETTRLFREISADPKKAESIIRGNIGQGAAGKTPAQLLTEEKERDRRVRERELAEGAASSDYVADDLQRAILGDTLTDMGVTPVGFLARPLVNLGQAVANPESTIPEKGVRQTGDTYMVGKGEEGVGYMYSEETAADARFDAASMLAGYGVGKVGGKLAKAGAKEMTRGATATDMVAQSRAAFESQRLSRVAAAANPNYPNLLNKANLETAKRTAAAAAETAAKAAASKVSAEKVNAAAGFAGKYGPELGLAGSNLGNAVRESRDEYRGNGPAAPTIIINNNNYVSNSYGDGERPGGI